MNRLIPRSLPLLLAIGLLAVLCACDVPTKTEAPTKTASPVYAPQPKQTEACLELDGADAGELFSYSDTFYLRADTLCGLWQMPCREEDKTLWLGPEDAELTLWDGIHEVRTGEGSTIDLGAPVLRCADGWYLPVSTLESLWGRTPVWDGTAVLRCLQSEPGPTVSLNGAAFGQAECCNGIPVLTAAQLAEVSGGSLMIEEDPAGVPQLTLQVWEHTITFRQGALEAELDGAMKSLPVPAWQRGEDWYLPAAAAEILGCETIEIGESDQISLLRTEEGPVCWFAGVEVGPLRRVDKVLCGDLAVLAEAAGGKILERDGHKVLSALGHVLTLSPGEAQAELDGGALTLSSPVMNTGENWLVPVEPVAKALGLSERTADCGVVYSQIASCETVLWLDGRQIPSYTCPDGGLYVRLEDANALLEGCFLPTGNEAILQTRDGELALRAGEKECTAQGEVIRLTAPTIADGTDWYVSAPEVLPALGLFELVDPELDQRYYTHIAKHDKIPQGVRVPVLMYHAVSDYIWGEEDLFVSPSVLEAQLQAMQEEGYTAITFEDLDHVDEIEKPVLLTFDDGYDDNYTKLFPLLQKYNVKATVFMIVNDIGKKHKLTLEQIQEMSESGLVSFQSHTMSHNFLNYMNEEQLRHEHYDSMVALARITGKQPFVLSYPTGRSSEFSRSITAEYYEYGLNMTGPCYVTGEPPFEIYRYYISRFTGVGAFLADLEG